MSAVLAGQFPHGPRCGNQRQIGYWMRQSAVFGGGSDRLTGRLEKKFIGSKDIGNAISGHGAKVAEVVERPNGLSRGVGLESPANTFRAGDGDGDAGEVSDAA
jgi:hypothetical protein